MARPIPSDRTVSYQFQRRKCGKASCSTCATGPGHGPYWYAYWAENGKALSSYVGKTLPESVQTNEETVSYH